MRDERRYPHPEAQPFCDAVGAPALGVLEKPGETSFRGYSSRGRYALALTQRLAIREAKKRKAESVLLFEDDIVIHPNFLALVSTVELPDDWGIFYFGCAHTQTADWCGSRVVRVREALDTHAVAIRAPYYDQVIEILDRHNKFIEGFPQASDRILAQLHGEIPTYACYPNLIWQAESVSDLLGGSYSNYTRDGFQQHSHEAIMHLLSDAISNPSGEVRDEKITIERRVIEKSSSGTEVSNSMPRRDRGLSRLGLLFLTRGDVNHPQIWSEYIDQSPNRVKVISHVKDPSEVVSEVISGTIIESSLETSWGDISLVRASLSLLDEAMQDPDLTHFMLLSESCVPIRPLTEILRLLDLDPRPRFHFKDRFEANSAHVSRTLSTNAIPTGCWRFQPQWWLLDRAAATFATAHDFTELFSGLFAPDELYFGTILSMQGYPLDGLVMNQSPTWTCWRGAKGSPRSFTTVPAANLNEMVNSGCFFARKFPVNSNIGDFGLHRL